MQKTCQTSVKITKNETEIIGKKRQNPSKPIINDQNRSKPIKTDQIDQNQS